MTEQPPQPQTPNAPEGVQLYVLKPESITRMNIATSNVRPEDMPCTNRGDEFNVGPVSALTPIVLKLRSECRGCTFRQPCLFNGVVEFLENKGTSDMIIGGTTSRQRVAAAKEVDKAMERRGTTRQDVRLGSLFTELMRISSEF